MSNQKVYVADLEKLQALIYAQGINLAEAARRCNLSPGYFSNKKEAGASTKRISVLAADSIEKYLGLKLETYIYKEPAPVPVYTAPDYETPEQLTIGNSIEYRILDTLQEIRESVARLELSLAYTKDVDNDPDW
jgi:transcriptional regulator with XRE-family HTH domain